MNRSAVRIRPPAPESPFGRTGFIIRRVRIRTCPVTLRRGRLAIPSCSCTPYESACNSGKPVRKNGLYHSPCADSDLSGYAAVRCALLFRRAVALLTNPPVTPESPFGRTGFIIRRARIRTCPVTLRCGAPCYSVVRLHFFQIRRILDFPSEKRVSVCRKFGIFTRCVVLSCNKLHVVPISLLSPRAVKFIIVVLIRFGRTEYDCR